MKKDKRLQIQNWNLNLQLFYWFTLKTYENIVSGCSNYLLKISEKLKELCLSIKPKSELIFQALLNNCESVDFSEAWSLSIMQNTMRWHNFAIEEQKQRFKVKTVGKKHPEKGIFQCLKWNI